jgi:hypothetical protein
MRNINRGRVRRNKRKQNVAESMFMRELRSDVEQLELIKTRRGESKRETARLLARINVNS